MKIPINYIFKIQTQGNNNNEYKCEEKMAPIYIQHILRIRCTVTIYSKLTQFGN